MIGLSDEQRTVRLDGIDLQRARWRLGEKDPALLEKGRRIIEELKKKPFIIQVLSLEYALYQGYIHAAAVGAGYEHFDIKGIGKFKQTRYEIPPIALERCRAILKKFEVR